MIYKIYKNFLILAIKNELTIINHVNLTKLANFSKTIVSDPEQTQDQEDPSPPSKKPKKGQGKAKKCKSKFDSPDIIDFDLKIDVNQGKSNLVLAVVFNDKIVKVLELDEDADAGKSKLEVLSTYYVPKRPTSIKFDNFISKDKASSLSQNSKNHFLLIADKNGDVYRRWDKFEVEKIDKNPDLKIKNETPIIGHISMLLDLQVDEKYIFTADRDEKVRISHRERAFDIFGYLLGHTEFVSDVFLIEGVDRCLTYSGDATLKIWDTKNCNCINTQTFDKKILKIIQSRQNSKKFHTIDENGKINFYQFSDENSKLEKISTNMEEPLSINEYLVDFTGQGEILKIKISDLVEKLEISDIPDKFYKSYDDSGLKKSLESLDRYPEKYVKMYLDGSMINQ